MSLPTEIDKNFLLTTKYSHFQCSLLTDLTSTQAQLWNFLATYTDIMLVCS